jgi:hypothetical protein
MDKFLSILKKNRFLNRRELCHKPWLRNKTVSTLDFLKSGRFVAQARIQRFLNLSSQERLRQEKPTSAKKEKDSE